MQNFFLSEIANIKAKIKNNCNQKTSKEISSRNDEKIELLQNQIIYLREKCNSKNRLINLILENVFKSDISKVTSYTNSPILQMTIVNSLKNLLKITIRKVLITATFMIIDCVHFLLMKTVKITMKIFTPQSHHVKHYILTRMKIKNIRPETLTEMDLLIGNSVREKSQQ